jgi:hypothetical protein
VARSQKKPAMTSGSRRPASKRPKRRKRAAITYQKLQTMYQKAYQIARRQVEQELGIVLPDEPEFTLEQALDPNFWPVNVHTKKKVQ